MKYLQEFIREVLKEGVKEDLIKLDPTLSSDFEKMESVLSSKGIPIQKQVKYLKWYSKFKNSNRDQKESVESILDSILDFERKAIKLKSKNLSTDLMSYDNIKDIRSAVESVLSEKERDIITSSSDYDLVYESDEWVVKFPRSTEASIAIALPGKTEWCTAEPDSTNSFCNYVMKDPIDNTWKNLYYAIRKHPQNNSTDYLSLGYKVAVDKYPKIILNGFGGASVDKNQKGLTTSRLQNIFKNEYDAILSSCLNHALEIQKAEGHPFEKKVEKAASDINEFNKIWRSFDPKDKSENAIEIKQKFLKNVLRHNSTIEMLHKIYDIADSSGTHDIKIDIADLLKRKEISNENFSLVEKLLNDDSKSATAIKVRLISNPYASEEFLRKMLKNAVSTDQYDHLLLSILDNPNVPDDILQNSISNANSSVRAKIAEHPKTPKSVLRDYEYDDDLFVKTMLASNKNTPPETLANLFLIGDEFINQWLKKNPSTPKNIKEKLKQKKHVSA